MSFIIIVITARFSPVYSLNDRMIVLAVGIEESSNGYSVILESNPSKDGEDTKVVKGIGNSVSACILNIEDNTNKKVSLAQVEILYLSLNLIKNYGIKYLDSEELKEIPEVAVVVATDKPSEIIGSKISDNKLKSFDIGSAIRENKEKVSVLEVNMKDLGRDYLSFLGTVTIPYVEVDRNNIIKNKENLLGANDEVNTTLGKENNENIKLKIEKGCSFCKGKSIILDKEDYLIYQLLNEKNNKLSGYISFPLDTEKTINLWINKITINKNNNIEKDIFTTEYKVNISFYDNESAIVDNSGINSKCKIDNSYKKVVEDVLNKMGSNFFNKLKLNKIDVMHLMDKYNIINETKINNEDNFMGKLSTEVSFSIVNEKIKN